MRMTVVGTGGLWAFLMFSLQLVNGDSSEANELVASMRFDTFTFAKKMFGQMVNRNPDTNIAISPAAIQSNLAFAFLGTGGTTADELFSLLELRNLTNAAIVANIRALETDTGDDDVDFHMVNKLFVNDRVGICENFTDLSNAHEKVDFTDNVKAAETINTWIEAYTAKHIAHVIGPGDLSADTSAILVNTFFMTGTWSAKFNVKETARADFHITKDQAIPVDMLFNRGLVENGHYPDLAATMLAIPFGRSNISMLILLPDEVDGLQSLEAKLVGNYLTEMHENYNVSAFEYYIPKFKIEVEMDLKPILRNMGLKDMFEATADFSQLVCAGSIHVNEIKHKTAIEVNEMGVNALPHPDPDDVPIRMDLNGSYDVFKADHPFVFVIHDNDIVYLSGHVTFQ